MPFSRIFRRLAGFCAFGFILLCSSLPSHAEIQWTSSPHPLYHSGYQASYTAVLGILNGIHEASEWGPCSSLGPYFGVGFGAVGSKVSGCAGGTYIALASCTGNGEVLRFESGLDYSCACPQGQAPDTNGVCQPDQEEKENGPPDECDGGPKSCSARPINFTSGNKFKVQNDYASANRNGLRFSRTYNSLGSGDNASEMGSHWHHNHDLRLTISSGSPVEIKAARADSKIDTYTESQTQPGTYLVDADVNRTLIQTVDGYQLTDVSDNIERYNLAGQLLSVTDKAGLSRAYRHDLISAQGGDDNPDTLDRITDPYGHTLRFSYNANGQIATLTDPDNNVIQYQYDNANNLSGLIWPDGSTRSYHYEDGRFANALTGITDENNRRVETYGYQDDGRAVLSEVSGGIERVTVVYLSDGTAEVTDTAGQIRSYHFDFILGVRRVTDIIGGPCLGCDNIQSAQYDSSGSVISNTDFNGNITTFSYDSRNQQIQRTEAYGSAEARSITTVWHSSYRLPLQIDRPGQRISYQYDTQGLLLGYSVTDTRSGSPDNGKIRTTLYDYTSQGRLQMVDGPRTDITDTIAYAYDNEGNLSSITNALGHITHFPAYNPHGQPTQIVNVNGITTELYYDSRRRLTQLVIAPDTAAESITRYQYDGVGNLLLVTLPDDSSLSYSYDLANRVTRIEDRDGNSIRYTLDAQGNRIDEQNQDPQGLLTRQIERSYDLYNRLQYIIGAGG